MGAEIPVELRASAVVFRDDRVLLVRRDRRDDWVLPGGYPEAGESLAHCAERELAEETGLRRRAEGCVLVLEADGEQLTHRVVDVVFLAHEDDDGQAHDDRDAAEADEPLTRRSPGLAPAFVPLADLPGLRLHPAPLARLLGAVHARRDATAAVVDSGSHPWEMALDLGESDDASHH
ncbi:NUDIX domain-containing protein [Streptomyces sp. PTM05]|uniref:NUDIX domain-containing protein n=1 Tax=Streptantibioticus parmotrematis TaxID=2873249 RepID=A0ABS7QSZ1_9ACTN|nr:NUDIX domain-containing protein [Streptantibioticus parmotrematis]MBY8885510.1 NUDIX domain-containing protein [Streptantibioticus parmotrematis]